MKIYDENQFLTNKNVSIDNFGTEGIDDLEPRKYEDVYTIIPSILKKWLLADIKYREEMLSKGVTKYTAKRDPISILGYKCVGNTSIGPDHIDFSFNINLESRPFKFDDDDFKSDKLNKKIRDNFQSLINKESSIFLNLTGIHDDKKELLLDIEGQGKLTY